MYNKEKKREKGKKEANILNIHMFYMDGMY
jgi:hypothetical protein